MKTLDKTHPIRRKLSSYFLERTASAWEAFANCCKAYGADPESINDRYNPERN